MQIPGRRGHFLLLATFATSTIILHGCSDPVEPNPVVDVTGEYDAALLGGRKLPVVYDSVATEWHAVVAEHLSLRADRSWEVLRTDRHTRAGIVTDSTFRALYGTWNNSAGGPAFLMAIGFQSSLRAALRSDTLMLTGGCRTIADCFASSGGITFVRSR